jgi:hypothetical protein
MRLLSVQGNLSIPEKTALSFYGFSCLLGIILAKASHIVRELGLNWLSLFAAALVIHLYSIPQHKGPARLISQFFVVYGVPCTAAKIVKRPFFRGKKSPADRAAKKPLE